MSLLGFPTFGVEVAKYLDREQHRRTAVSEWQPIETAPKDGTGVLGYFPELKGYVAPQEFIPMHWSGWGGGIWCNSTSGHNLLSAKPTHWMPLPKAPPPPEVK